MARPAGAGGTAPLSPALAAGGGRSYLYHDPTTSQKSPPFPETRNHRPFPFSSVYGRRPMTTEGFALLLLLLAAAEAGRRSEALWKAAATQGRGAVGNIGGSEDKPCAPPSPPQLVHDPAPSRPFQTGLLPEASGTSPNPSPPSATHAPTAAAGHDRAGSRSGAEMVYIGAHGVETLKRYRYIGQDHSVVAKYVLQPFWTRCVTLFPLWMPNYRYALEKHRERKGIGAAERFVLGKPSRVQLNWIGD